MNSTSSNWQMPTFFTNDEQFFHSSEQKQVYVAYRNFLRNTKSPGFDDDDDEQDETDLSEDDEDLQVFFHSKVQLFQLFIRTQSINIRQFSSFHRDQQRILVERLFYLVLNNVELTNFSSFNIQSIINISKELEKYQKTTRKIISNTSKLNNIIQFVLSFSPSTVSAFRLNNLFYILLNDMNDFSGKLIDRIAEVLRVYHFMTFGHSISKQYLIGTIDNAINTANYANPIVYPFYENFLNSSYSYKGPFLIASSSSNNDGSFGPLRVSLFTMVQNLSILLLGFTVDDFDCEEQFLSITSEQCYHIRLIIRRLNYLFLKYHYLIEYPLNQIDKQIVLHLIKSVVIREKTADHLGRLLDHYMITIHGFSETKIKRLLYDLLIQNSFDFHSIETIRYFFELNRLTNDDRIETTSDLSQDQLNTEDDFWLTDEQNHLVAHRLYSKEIYQEIFLPLIHGDCQGKKTIEDLLNCLDKEHSDDEQFMDVHEIKRKLTINQ